MSRRRRRKPERARRESESQEAVRVELTYQIQKTDGKLEGRYSGGKKSLNFLKDKNALTA